MDVVYRAHDREAHRDVALKSLRVWDPEEIHHLKRVTYQYTAREDDAGNMIATADGKAMGRLCEAAPVFDHMEDAR